MIPRLPLRHTLPLIVAGLAGVVLLLAVLFANVEVRRSARLAAEERLQRVVDQIAALAASSAQQRALILRQVGRAPALAALLRGEPVDDDALMDALEALRAPSDSGLPVQVWDRDMRVVFSDPAEDARGAAPLEAYTPPRVPLDSVPAYGAFHEVGDDVLYYSTAPVVSGGRVLGWIVQRRRIGNPRTASELESLIGRDARVLFSYPGDSLWITLAGDVVAAPVRELPLDSTVLVRSAGGAHLLRAGQVSGTPWRVLLEMPETVIDVRPETFLRRMLLFGVVLVFGAVVIAWALARRLTEPLTELVAASEAVARGDYTRRVTPQSGGDELIRLAASYNVMAAQVSVSHDALRRRLDEARALARELEAARLEAERAREAAQAGDRAKSDFLATMSHEIRTPINAVLGYCDLLELEHLPDETRQDYIGRTRRAARRLAALVEDVLDLSKVDAGELRIQPEERPLRATVEGTLALLEDEVARKKLGVTLAVDSECEYRADPHRVEQILVNLLSNAIKFTPEGGRIVLRGSTRPGDGGRVSIAVEDSGIGVPPGELERIFEPFVQAQTGYTRQYGGTGLGLSISRRLARLMDGDIVARSEPGAGSTFTLILPAAEPSHTTAG